MVRTIARDDMAPRSRGARTGALLVTLALTVAPALALCPKPAPRLCSELFRADAVFVGQLQATEYFPPGGDDLEVHYVKLTFRVVRALRGNPGATAIVLTANDSARWSGVVGETYVVFSRHGRIAATCTALDEPGYVEEIDRELAALASRTTATIEGEVIRAPGEEGRAPSPGAVVTAYGMTASYRATAGADGRFALEVPPGVYVLVTPGLHSSDYSRPSDEPIELAAGECAQFELVRDR